MYSKLGSLEHARFLFEKMPKRDCVVWNTMVSAYSQNGYPKESMELLIQMRRYGVRAILLSVVGVNFKKLLAKIVN